jgi:hypothetical protein
VKPAFALLVILATVPANAGTCHYYSVGMDSVREYTDGSVVVVGPRGRVRQFGEHMRAFRSIPASGHASRTRGARNTALPGLAAPRLAQPCRAILRW